MPDKPAVHRVEAAVSDKEQALMVDHVLGFLTTRVDDLAANKLQACVNFMNDKLKVRMQ